MIGSCGNATRKPVRAGELLRVRKRQIEEYHVPLGIARALERLGDALDADEGRSGPALRERLPDEVRVGGVVLDEEDPKRIGGTGAELRRALRGLRGQPRRPRVGERPRASA